jgi:hypothetical protein
MLSRINRAMPTNAGAAVVARPRTRGVTPFALRGLDSIKSGATGSMYGVEVLDSNLRPTDSAGGTTG